MHRARVGTQFHVRAKSVINATGPYTDSIRQLDKPETRPICEPSAGVHIILPDYYWHVARLSPLPSRVAVVLVLLLSSRTCTVSICSSLCCRVLLLSL